MDNGLGDGGERLHDWAFSTGDATDQSGSPGRPAGVNGEVFDEMLATGRWRRQIFVLSRHRPSAEVARWPLVTYVGDVETAMARAKEAAGEKNVLVHGAGTARLALAAGVLDEIQIHLIPVLFGEGRRLFEHLGAGPGVTHLRYRVCRRAGRRPS